MDIGEKLKCARSSAQLTQEQAAEALGVSRQTISNWENEKTYPDIIAVIKMSDIYNISLDELLKGSNKSDYFSYLEESTNMVKIKKHFSEILIIIAFLIIFAVSLLVFWCFINGSDALGYALVFLYIVFPVTILILSFLIGRRELFGRKNFYSSIIFGIMYMLAEYLTFNMANMISFNKLNIPHFELILIGTAISAFGYIAGKMIKHIIKKRK
ncbi:MAG: helix-turn-helix transcriptional regulator [Oscillospiraceae bacterium]|nr:helix-turn-helix transcriptional regulator [Oscillospiraceae bacterium]